MAFIIAILAAVLLWFLAPTVFNAVLMISLCTYVLSSVLGQIVGEVRKQRP